jgi:hypothetical protein
MTVFQLVALPCVALLAIRSLFQLSRPSGPRSLAAAGLLIWLLAFGAILRPDLTTALASLVGIGRGADLVLYLFCVCFILAGFYLYNRFQRMESHITDLARQLAVRDAMQRWPNEPDAGGPSHP